MAHPYRLQVTLFSLVKNASPPTASPLALPLKPSQLHLSLFSLSTDCLPPTKHPPLSPLPSDNKMSHIAADFAQHLPVHPAERDQSHTGVTHTTQQSSLQTAPNGTPQLHHQTPVKPPSELGCPEGLSDSMQTSTVTTHSSEPVGKQIGHGGISPVPAPEQNRTSPGLTPRQSGAKQGLGADADSLQTLLSCPITKVKGFDSLLVLTKFVKCTTEWVGQEQFVQHCILHP